MKLGEKVLQSLQTLSVEIGPQPVCAFVTEAAKQACGACSGDCKGSAFWD